MSDVIQKPVQPIEQPEKQLSEIEKFLKLKKQMEKLGYLLTDDHLQGIIEGAKIKRIVTVNQFENGYRVLTLENDSIQVTPNGSEQQILVFPRGSHFIEKVNKTLEFNDAFFSQIAESFNDTNLSRPYIDKNHEYKESYGKVLGYEVKEEGMFFNIKLNQEGIDLVRGELYTSISPSFGPQTDTTERAHENALVTISLTNIPALMGALPALQDQLELDRQKKEGKRMELTKITKVLNLQAGSSEEVIMGAIDTLNALLATLQETVASQGEEIKEKDESIEQMSGELSKVKEDALNVEAEATIDKAIELGQYHPALRDIKIESYKTNKEAVVTELSLIPENEEKAVTLSAKTQHTTNELTADEREMMLSLNMDIDDPKERRNFIKDTRG